MSFEKNIFIPLILAHNCAQSCKLLRHLGTSCPVGLETSSRILKVYPALFALSRILKANQALLGYFCTFLTDFRHFWTDFGDFRTDFVHFHTDFGQILADYDHFFTAFVSRIWIKASGAQ